MCLQKNKKVVKQHIFAKYKFTTKPPTISTKQTFICNIVKSCKHHQKNEETYKLVSKLIENLLTCGVCDLTTKVIRVCYNSKARTLHQKICEKN
jgi:hypothetical protein